MKSKHVTEKKKCICYGCGAKSTRTYNFTLQKWTRAFKCSKCYSESFRWFNFD